MSSIFWLRGSDLNRRPSGYAYHYSFRYFDESNLLVWTFPSPTPEAFGCLPSSLYTFSEIIMRCFRAWLGITISGFPEFDRSSRATFIARSPL